jgi:type IV pilus assembly protein PilB
MDVIDPEVLEQLPMGFCQTHRVLPLRLEGDTLFIATSDPLDESLSERVRFLANRPIRWVLAAPDHIEIATIVAMGKVAAIQAAGDGLIPGDGGGDGTSDNAIVTLGRAMLVSAIKQRASDLHIQPFLGAASVRIRVDGALRRVTMLPDAVAVTLIRHFKALSGMDSTNRLIPQDGRMSMVTSGREFDMRVSALPAGNGERLVIRFLEQGTVHRLSGAGFSLAALQTLRRAINRPSGLILLTGPTGCGKTSTLYAMLSELNNSAVNIITVENPVEYRVPGLSQVEVNDRAGRSFATAMRSILRQDPDIILIGEIRDSETAETAIQAALTGHLVLSTLHTNDALTAIPRLLGLGLQPTMLADSLITIAAQRLCRRLCPECSIPVTDPLTVEERLFVETTRNRPGRRPVGCGKCGYTGYHRRLPIVDIVEVTTALRYGIASGEMRLPELEKLREGGLKSLAASGALRVISGETTVREVMDSVGPTFWPELARHFGTQIDMKEDLLYPDHTTSDPAVLLMSTDTAFAKALEPRLGEQGYRLMTVPSRELARESLLADERIVFIIGDVPDDVTVEEAAQCFQENRKYIAWARLPSVVLVPPAVASQRDYLRNSGVLGGLMAKPCDFDQLIVDIRRSQAR